MSGWHTKRRRPYTPIGIERVKCVRCGKRAKFQWQVCSDGNVFRPLCVDCDVELNEMILRWARDPKRRSKMRAYRAKLGKENRR